MGNFVKNQSRDLRNQTACSVQKINFWFQCVKFTNKKNKTIQFGGRAAYSSKYICGVPLNTKK